VHSTLASTALRARIDHLEPLTPYNAAQIIVSWLHAVCLLS